MSETAGGKNRRKRKSRVPAGEDLVMGELSRRGFEAQLSDRKEHVLLVQAGDSAPKPVQVKTAHSTPWYVRRASFDGSLADQVTVYVLLGLERGIRSTRFWPGTVISRPSFGDRRLPTLLDSSTLSLSRNTKITGIF